MCTRGPLVTKKTVVSVAVVGEILRANMQKRPTHVQMRRTHVPKRHTYMKRGAHMCTRGLLVENNTVVCVAVVGEIQYTDMQMRPTQVPKRPTYV